MTQSACFEQLRMALEVGRGGLLANMDIVVTQHQPRVERDQRPVASIGAIPAERTLHVAVDAAIVSSRRSRCSAITLRAVLAAQMNRTERKARTAPGRAPQ